MLVENQLPLVVSQPAVLTEKGIIKELKGITENRFIAISMYPSSKHFAESKACVDLLRDSLNEADQSLNYKSAVKICLRLENHLLYLAPRSTVKIFNTYKSKVDFYMNACRVLLNYQIQTV